MKQRAPSFAETAPPATHRTGVRAPFIVRFAGLVLVGASFLPSGCLRRQSVNPDIIIPGAPGNSPNAPLSGAAGSDPNADLIFLGSEAVIVPAGTEILVRLTGVLDTSSGGVGDPFSALLAQPLYQAEKLVALPGTPLQGQVTDVWMREDDKSAELSINLLQILINDRWFPLRTNLLTVQASDRGADPLEALSQPWQDPARDSHQRRTAHIAGRSVRLPAGQTILFRLAEPAFLETSRGVP
ncbi:MAG: hypothetical protein HYX74_02920 [Acidobacteria bacterium]|nr:hypothetical protein [Acidobacteriota bacterium]